MILLFFLLYYNANLTKVPNFEYKAEERKIWLFFEQREVTWDSEINKAGLKII